MATRDITQVDDGLPTIIQAEDADLFGSGVVGSRPGSGDFTGDLWLLDAGSGNFYLQRWDGAAWDNITVAPPQGGSAANRLAIYADTSGSVLKATATATLNDSSQLAGLVTGTFSSEYSNGSLGATPTINWNNGQKQTGTLSANITGITFTAPPGPGNFILRIVQDSTPRTVTGWPGSVEWVGGTAPTISTGSGAVDIITFYYNGTTYYGAYAQDFS